VTEGFTLPGQPREERRRASQTEAAERTQARSHAGRKEGRQEGRQARRQEAGAPRHRIASWRRWPGSGNCRRSASEQIRQRADPPAVVAAASGGSCWCVLVPGRGRASREGEEERVRGRGGELWPRTVARDVESS